MLQKNITPMNEEPIATVKYNFYAPEYLSGIETADDKLDPALSFSLERLSKVRSLKNQLAPVCHRL